MTAGDGRGDCVTPIRRRLQCYRPLKKGDPMDTLPVTSGLAPVADGQLYYEVLGEGPPLVLVHGGMNDRRMWDDQWAAFAQHYRVVRYDLRGVGQSPRAE